MENEMINPFNTPLAKKMFALQDEIKGGQASTNDFRIHLRNDRSIVVTLEPSNNTYSIMLKQFIPRQCRLSEHQLLDCFDIPYGAANISELKATINLIKDCINS
jgi:hypothetical protein